MKQQGEQQAGLNAQTIAKSIEKNHPEIFLIVLLVAERPEEDFLGAMSKGL